jgi:serine/threonine-protein kinase
VANLVLDRWRRGERIGSGGFGRVYEATSDDGSAVVKFVKKLPGADRELLLGGDLADAVNVIPIIESGETETDWVLVMPRAEMSLEDHLTAVGPMLDPAAAIPVLVDIATALESLHGRVVHRDLKPGNVLLYQGHWCLTDFGISRYADATTDPATRKFAMTPQYAAPEQWRHERATSATDVYAFGVLAFRMLSSQLPFPGPGFEEYREQHLHGAAPPLAGVPPALAALVRQCLYKSQEARPSPADILHRLRGIVPTPPSSAIERLQAASLAETERRAEHGRQSSEAQSAEARRAALADAARDTLTQISAELRDTIMGAAAEAQLRGTGPSWSITLGNAVLTFAGLTITPANPWGAWGEGVRGLDVVAQTSLDLRFPRTLTDWEGRSHSLWFCNYADRAEYAWFEGAFMNDYRMDQPRVVPYALPPGENAAKALNISLVSQFQVDWPFSRLTMGDLGEFIERWVGWFGDAAAGQPRYPNKWPERR